MKRVIQQSAILAIILLIASSCLDIQESVYLRDNGSGKFALTVNLENLESIFKLVEQFGGGKEAGQEILADTEVDFNQLKDKLERQQGIQNVTRIQENQNKLLGIAFDFDDVDALNRALKELNDSKKDNTGSQEYFIYQNGQLTRTNTQEITNKVQESIEHETDIDASINGMMISSLLKDMRYTTKYTFERPVKKTSNPASKITNEGRTVTLSYHFFDQEPGSAGLENNINF